MGEVDQATSGERERGELLELEQLACGRGRHVPPETQDRNERVADGLRTTGDVIRWMRTGERPGKDEPIARTAWVWWRAEPAWAGVMRGCDLHHTVPQAM